MRPSTDGAMWQMTWGRADDAAEYADYSLRLASTPLANRVLGDVWRKRGDREQEEIRAWLLQDRPGDITIPAK